LVGAYSKMGIFAVARGAKSYHRDGWSQARLTDGARRGFGEAGPLRKMTRKVPDGG
jgi:hypothetical protein